MMSCSSGLPVRTSRVGQASGSASHPRLPARHDSFRLTSNICMGMATMLARIA